MKKINLVFILTIACALFVCASGVASATTYYVPDDHEKIQWAVDNATDGDMIIVRGGTYIENVDVNKDHLTIKSESGAEATIVQAANPDDHVFEVTADYVEISGFTVKGATEHHLAGFYLDNVEGCRINNTNVINNSNGIKLNYSGNNTLTNNSIDSNNFYGLFLYYSSNNTLENNKLSDNTYNFNLFGNSLYHFMQNIDTSNTINEMPMLYLVNKKDEILNQLENIGYLGVINSTNITVTNSTLKNKNGQGVLFAYVNNSRIEYMNISNSLFAVFLTHSFSNAIESNNISGGSFLSSGILAVESSSNIVKRNYFHHIGMFCIGLETSDNNIIERNNLSSPFNGIYISSSSNNTLKQNNISDNTLGISLSCSTGNIIEKNTISNNYYAIEFNEAPNNTIFLNNFVENTHNVHFHSHTNWNSTEPITYTYNNSTYTSYLGNYWDDYKEKYPGAEVVDGTGIWDTPYSLNSVKDNYPLVESWENYFKPIEEKIFDTGSPANPYPSIMGNHTGTIKPNHTVIATKLYTYPCPGTGGHTEYARIWNKTWNATATWEGYAGDWHNITFDKTVVLLGGETYNYTIRTGSYPQIHHNTSLLTPNGWINCTKFVDTNGKIYDDWIPAIRLE